MDKCYFHLFRMKGRICLLRSTTWQAYMLKHEDVSFHFRLACKMHRMSRSSPVKLRVLFPSSTSNLAVHNSLEVNSTCQGHDQA